MTQWLRPLLAAAVGSVVLTASVPVADPRAPCDGRVERGDEPLVGAYVAGAPFDRSRLDAFIDLVETPPDIVMWYQDWAEPEVREFHPGRADAVRAVDAIPMLTWDPWDRHAGRDQDRYSLASIIDGRHDAYIRRFAESVASWGHVIWLRLAHEMNGDWYPWGQRVNGNTPAAFVAAWRHVVSLFREVGATSVEWVWSPNVLFAGGPSLAELYPGDEWVDRVGMDGYNWGGARWQEPLELFAASATELCALTSRPLIIAEIGSAEAGGDKARWIDDAFVMVRDRLTAVSAVVWFHENKERDWRVSSSERALAAFRRQLGGPQRAAGRRTDAHDVHEARRHADPLRVADGLLHEAAY